MKNTLLAGIPFLFMLAPSFAGDALPKNAVPLPEVAYKLGPTALSTPPPGFTKVMTDGRDTLLLLDKALFERGELAVRFKTLATEGDQAAGIVFRCKDSKNFCVIRASTGGETCEFARYKNGKEKVLDPKDVIVSPFTWHELRITFTKESYTALLDGELILGGKDSSLKGASQVGLWTKANSVIAFDNFRVAQ